MKWVKRGLSIVALSGYSIVWGQAGQTSPAQDQSQAPPASASSGQSASQSPAAAPASSEIPMTFDKIDFAITLDGYYSWNNNHPITGFNQLYNMDDKTDQIGLNLGKLTISHDPDPIGFRVDVGAGRAMDIIHTPTPDPAGFRYLEQAYVSLKPKSLKGFEADFGEFVTSAGAEVIETRDNWNYSRSLLFSWATPYYHFGIRTSMPIGSSFTVGVQIVDGWNAIVNTYGNNMQTVGITAAITRKKFTWSHNYYVGPEYNGTNSKTRNLYDTTLLLTPNSRLSAYVNYDYVAQNEPIAGSAHWTGVAGALRFQLSKHFAISPRAEYFNDPSGFSTGTVQKIHEVTVTGEYKLNDGFLTRLEYRHDGSNVPFFNHGLQSAVSQTQSTVTLGLVAWVGPKH
ncbi:MAG: porin [Acidobacteriaceae bacterium]|nr:porin [Acidobacteriaceae bacterium]